MQSTNCSGLSFPTNVASVSVGVLLSAIVHPPVDNASKSINAEGQQPEMVTGGLTSDPSKGPLATKVPSCAPHSPNISSACSKSFVMMGRSSIRSHLPSSIRVTISGSVFAGPGGAPPFLAMRMLASDTRGSLPLSLRAPSPNVRAPCCCSSAALTAKEEDMAMTARMAAVLRNVMMMVGCCCFVFLRCCVRLLACSFAMISFL
mmetsp:Transcript_21852/g.62271  ORF Transcript_21852/g.62271 Transcript_21852/m.62271 type:complete len:204 (+) Transcript_21852:139-750(+)